MSKNPIYTLDAKYGKEIQALVQKNFPQHLHPNGKLRLYPDLTKEYEFDVEANLERLCYQIGPGFIKGTHQSAPDLSNPVLRVQDSKLYEYFRFSRRTHSIKRQYR